MSQLRETGSARSEEGRGVHRPAVPSHFEVEVGSRRSPGGANLGDGCTGCDLLADPHRVLRIVSVHRLEPIAMADHDHVAVALLLAAERDCSGAKREDFRARGRGKVDSCVVPELPREGVPPYPEVR